MHRASAPFAALVALAVVLAIAGCGGSDSTSPSSGAQTTAPEKSAAAAKGKPGASAKDGNNTGKTRKAGKKQARKSDKDPRSPAERQVEEIIRKSDGSGAQVDADSKVARKILKSLSEDNGSGKKGKESIAKKVREIISGSGSGSGSSGSADDKPGDSSVDKILEQIGK